MGDLRIELQAPVLRHNNGCDACAWRDCAFAKARLSCRCSHNRLVCLISWHVFQKVYAISCLR